jgi:RES domain-containing protein
MAIEVPGDAGLTSVAAGDLPADWNKGPDHPACVAIGDAWVADGAALLLRVPSAGVPEDWNLLINPRHPRARDVAVRAVRPFAFDPRLL